MQASENTQKAKFAEFGLCEVRRIPIPRTPVNKGKRKGRGFRPRPSPLRSPGLFAYLIVPRGPPFLKLRELRAWMPASWSPSNGVTVFEQPASLASFGSANHTPRWKVCIGSNFTPFLASALSTCGGFTAPGEMANTSSLKIPTKCPVPWPWLSVAMSPWYQETPKGVLARWMRKTVKSVFLAALLRVMYRFWLPWPASVTLTFAEAPLRHLPPLTAAADCERTILNCLRAALADDVLATATPASSAPTSNAAPKMSHGRARFLVLIPLVPFLARSSWSFRSLSTVNVERGRLCASLCTPFLRFGLAYTNGWCSLVKAALLPWVFLGCSRSPAARLRGGASEDLLTAGTPLGRVSRAHGRCPIPHQRHPRRRSTMLLAPERW